LAPPYFARRLADAPRMVFFSQNTFGCIGEAAAAGYGPRCNTPELNQ